MRLRKGRFGSRLLVKLAAIFALVGLMPGVLIYVVSYQFVTRSIESWFDVKVEGALVAGVNWLGCRWSRRPPTWPPRRARPVPRWPRAHSATVGWRWSESGDQLGATDVVLWNAAGGADWQRGVVPLQSQSERPSAALLRSAREQRAVTQIEGVGRDRRPQNAVQMAA